MKSEENKFNLIIFLAVLILSFSTNFIGKVYIGGIIALFFVFFKRVALPKSFITGIKLVFLWAFVQILSDYVNSTGLDSSLKGIAAPLILICTSIFFYDCFVNHPKRLPIFFLALAISSFITKIIHETELLTANPWKWGLGPVVNLCFAIFISYFYKKPSTLLIIIFTIVFFVYSNLVSARSISGMCLATILFFFLRRANVNVYFKSILNSTFGLQKVIIGLVFVVIALNFLFTTIFLSDFYLSRLDADSRSKAFTQASSKYGAILGGRSESLISVEAFFDKPILGHGSWAKDKNNYIE